MRIALPAAPALPAQVFAISGLCQHSTFRWSPAPGESLVAHLGSAQFAGGEDPYVLVRRTAGPGTESTAAVALLRLDWEGVFTLLSTDDILAESLFTALVAPASPEEVRRDWTAEASTLELFRAWNQPTP